MNDDFIFLSKKIEKYFCKENIIENIFWLLSSAD